MTAAPAAVASAVAAAVSSAYASAGGHSGKPDASRAQWTVLAGLALLSEQKQKQSATAPHPPMHIHVAALATGTKCLGTFFTAGFIDLRLYLYSLSYIYFCRCCTSTYTTWLVPGWACLLFRRTSAYTNIRKMLFHA